MSDALRAQHNVHRFLCMMESSWRVVSARSDVAFALARMVTATLSDCFHSHGSLCVVTYLSMYSASVASPGSADVRHTQVRYFGRCQGSTSVLVAP